MLTGQFPNELRLLIPDMDIAPHSFHDIMIKDLSASPSRRSCLVLPGDVTSLLLSAGAGRIGYFGHCGSVNFHAVAPCVRRIS